jgi:hypothetical protein
LAVLLIAAHCLVVECLGVLVVPTYLRQ